MVKKRLLAMAATVGVLAFTVTRSISPNQASAAPPSSGSVPVEVVSPLPLPVTGSHERISFETLVSLEVNQLSGGVEHVYDVPAGNVFVIENVQYDTNAGYFFKYQPTVTLRRPIDLGFSFDRYNLAIVLPEAFASGGGAFLSAATHRVSLNVPPLGSVGFDILRNVGDCSGQIRYRVDGRLEMIQ